MSKTKSKTILKTADGRGGMVEIKDRRFESSDWPIKFEVPVDGEQADRWPRYLNAACHRRGWGSSTHAQLERAENSGTISILANDGPKLDVTWERKRDRPMKVRARIAPTSTLPLAEAKQFLSDVTDNCRLAVTEPIYVRRTLEYDQGLAWRGEFWLDDKICLSPPSQQYETAMIGPRHVHVDMVLECIGQQDVNIAGQELLLGCGLIKSEPQSNCSELCESQIG